jgi:DNA-binding NarL/FixJ family response regulator
MNMNGSAMENIEAQKTRVVIADDHAILREGLVNLLTDQPDIEVVAEANNGEDALSRVQELSPDILLLDLMMPKMDGVQVLQELSKLKMPTKAIVLTGADDDDMLTRSVQSGAAGFLLKDSASSMLLDAIRTVAAGNCWLPPGLTERLFRGISKSAQGQDSAKISLLTAREIEVLKLLGEAQSNAQIADALFISEHTVKVHVSRILDKLELETRAEAIRFAIHVGLVKA